MATVAMGTIFKLSIELTNDFRGGKHTVHELGYPEESNMRGSTVLEHYFECVRFAASDC